MQASDFGDALAYYRDFMAYTLEDENIALCPLLVYLRQHGDTAVHTWRTVSRWLKRVKQREEVEDRDDAP